MLDIWCYLYCYLSASWTLVTIRIYTKISDLAEYGNISAEYPMFDAEFWNLCITYVAVIHFTVVPQCKTINLPAVLDANMTNEAEWDKNISCGSPWANECVKSTYNVILWTSNAIYLHFITTGLIIIFDNEQRTFGRNQILISIIIYSVCIELFVYVYFGK